MLIGWAIAPFGGVGETPSSRFFAHLNLAGLSDADQSSVKNFLRAETNIALAGLVRNRRMTLNMRNSND